MPFTLAGPIDLVRQATVQLISGRRTGTGFFVSPHVIVTCAHVLSGPEGKVSVLARGRTVSGKILLRLPRTGPRADYPFPDIAFIGVEEPIDTPHVDVHSLHLKHGEGEGIDLQVHGFNSETPEPDAVLDLVPISVIAASGRYIKAEADGIIKGMSGAPVVHPNTGLVCGILKYFRPDQRAAWFVDGIEIVNALAAHRRLLRHAPQRQQLFRPEPTDPLYTMLTAQKLVAEELPYQVVDGDVPLSAVYVEQRAEAWSWEARYAARFNRGAPPEPTPITPYDMLARHRNALIVGGPGGGKSTLLQHIVAESAGWWTRAEPVRPGEQPPFGAAVAIRCPATRLLSGRSWSEAVADSVNAELHGFLRAPVDSAIFKREPLPFVEWLILVDGLDEVLEVRKRADLIRILAMRIGEYGSQARFVVASRHLTDREFGQLRSMLMAGQPDRLGEYDLRPFDRPAVAEFARRWFDLREPEHAQERTAGFLARIAGSRLMQLVSIPLLCTIAADVYQSHPDSPLPIGRAGLYSRFIEGLLTGRKVHLEARDKLRAQLAPLGRSAEEFAEVLFDRRLDCLTFLAETRLSKDRNPTADLARDWLEREGIAVPFGVTDDHIRESLLSTGLVTNRGDGLEFTHQSIAEYLASRNAVANFDERAWLTQTLSNVDSRSMFELDNWAAAGNDTLPVARALADPGEDGEFPRLPQLAAAVQDGAVLAGGNTDAPIGLVMQAVESINVQRDQTLPAVNHAARALVQRAPDISGLIELARSRAVPVRKRIEVAKVLVTDGDEADREHGLEVLVALGYQPRLSTLDRLVALQALAEVGGALERTSAVQHIAAVLETERSRQARFGAIQTLGALGELSEGIFALVRRLADAGRAIEERVGVSDDLVFIEDFIDLEDGQQPNRYQGGQVAPGQVWSPVRTVGDWYARHEEVTTAAGLLLAAGRLDPDVAIAAVSIVMHDRTLTWGDRLRIARTLGSDGGSYLAQVAFEQFADDPDAPPSVRVVNRWLYRQRDDPAGAEAMLRGIVLDKRAGIAERHCALDTLLTRGPDRAVAFVASCTRNPTLEPSLRIPAAAGIGRRRSGRAQGLALLAALRTDPDLPVRWRWAASIATAAVAMQPVTDYLLNRDGLEELIGRIGDWLWERGERLVERFRLRWRRFGRSLATYLGLPPSRY